MKATGIVRRIDDLGRLLCQRNTADTAHQRRRPLEILRIMREASFKKYSPIGELSGFAKQYAEALSQTSGCIVSITDREQHIAVSGRDAKTSEQRFK